MSQKPGSFQRFAEGVPGAFAGDKTIVTDGETLRLAGFRAAPSKAVEFARQFGIQRRKATDIMRAK